MVTAKGAEIDTVVGLEVGADDYVTKPYRLRELVARMRAVLRRRRRATSRRRRRCCVDEVVEVGDVRVDHERHEVVIRGDEVRLPLKEFELLALLLENAGRVLTRETADRPGVGRRLRRRHQDPRRPHQAAAVQGRGRSRRARPASSPSAAWATSTRRPGPDRPTGAPRPLAGCGRYTYHWRR